MSSTMETLHAMMSAFTEYNTAMTLGLGYAVIAAVAWTIVGLGAGWAVFHRDIRDTIWERIALALISIAGLSRVFFVIGHGEVPLDGLLTAISLAMYVCVVWHKHKFIIPRRRAGMPDRRDGKKK